MRTMNETAKIAESGTIPYKRGEDFEKTVETCIRQAFTVVFKKTLSPAAVIKGEDRLRPLRDSLADPLALFFTSRPRSQKIGVARSYTISDPNIDVGFYGRETNVTAEARITKDLTIEAQITVSFNGERGVWPVTFNLT